MADVERRVKGELEKHLLCLADWGKSGEIKAYQLPPDFNCTMHWSYQFSCLGQNAGP